MKEQALNSGPLAKQETSLTTRPWLCGYRIFFVTPACHQLVLDGFDQQLNFLHFQLSLNSASNDKSQQHQIVLKKKSGMLIIKPGMAGWEARMCYAVPLGTDS